MDRLTNNEQLRKSPIAGAPLKLFSSIRFRRPMNLNPQKQTLTARSSHPNSNEMQATHLHKRSMLDDLSRGKDYVNLLWPNELKKKVKRQQAASGQRLRKRRTLFKSLDSRSPRTLSLPKNPLEQYVTHSNHYYARKKSSEEYHSEHLEATFAGFRTIAGLQGIPAKTLQAKTVSLPQSSFSKTLVLDLDETLVHCCEGSEVPDSFIQVTLPSGEEVAAGLRLRPFLIECLTKIKEWFEVIVFTASHQCYADAVLNFIDPAGQLIDHRLYRDSCISVSGVNIKDLRILNRNLKDVVIVDNLVQSFANQLDNGIPIISWYEDRKDKELFKLIKYLDLLAHVQDVREVNRRMFKLESFYEDYLRSKSKSASILVSPRETG